MDEEKDEKEKEKLQWKHWRLRKYDKIENKIEWHKEKYNKFKKIEKGKKKERNLKVKMTINES